MSDIIVKPIDQSYAQVLSDLGRRLFADTFSAENDPADIEAFLNDAYTLEHQQRELNDASMHSFMAFDKDIPIGFAQLRENKDVYDFVGDKEAIELQRIYVDKAYAGKGIGKALYNACLQKANELNKKTMWLGVWEFNPVAIKFYERQGFYKVGSHIFKVGEKEDTDHVMVKKL
ncbi:hypothetical protein INT47_001131 [Mucor saturninus]|uniref:N-acetyltransferase domain-containing protein n=1 Tax=Mucor saturninus TaxID=64648 RepID=A0A8H7VCL1_9FUNG|nr:hypothetical protein INT47_001131 [Mucor saturninus]